MAVMITAILLLLLVHVGPDMAKDGNLWMLGVCLWLGLGVLGLMYITDCSLWAILWLIVCPLAMAPGPLWFAFGYIPKRLRQK